MRLVNTGDPTDDSTERYKETSLWESGPLPILTLLSRFVVVMLLFDSLLLADAITSGDSLLLVATVADSFSLLAVWVDRDAHVASGLPFFWSFNSIS